MKPNTPVTGRRYPAQRMVLTPVAAVELINRMQQVGAALAQAGVLKANPRLPARSRRRGLQHAELTRGAASLSQQALAKEERRHSRAAAFLLLVVVRLEQPEHGLAGLRGERQGGGRKLLPGLQREKVCAFLVGVGEREASAPVCSVLIIALVKSWRICTVDRFEPNAWAWARSVVSAAVRSVEAAVMSAAPPQLFGGVVDARSPAALKSTAATVTLEVPVSFSVTVRSELALLSSRLMPLKPGVGGELIDLGDDFAELGGEARADRRVGGLLRLGNKRLGRLHQLGDRGDAVVGGLNGVERARHRVEQAAQGRWRGSTGPAR